MKKQKKEGRKEREGRKEQSKEGNQIEYGENLYFQITLPAAENSKHLISKQCHGQTELLIQT